ARKGGKGVAAVEEVAVVEAALGAAVVAVAVAPGGGSSGGGADLLAGGGSNSGVGSTAALGPSAIVGTWRTREHWPQQQNYQLSGDLEDPGALATAAELPARCFHRLDDLYHARWGPEATTPRWARLLARKIPVFELSMDDARQYALYADVDYSADRYVCSRVRSLGCLPPVCVDLCLSSLGACVSALGACVASGPATPSAEASLSFTLDSGTSQCFFRDHTTLTPLLAPVPIALADPSSGPAVERSSTTLPCPVAPFGCPAQPPHPLVHSELGSPAMVSTFSTPSAPRLLPPHRVVSGQVAASCSCRSLPHPTVLWHHCLGHLSLPRLRNMASHSLVSSLPCVFSSLPPSLTLPCTPCIAGRLRATLHSSSLCLATAPFQTLHLDSEVTSTLIRWLLATEGTRGSRVRYLHSDRGGEFRFGVLAGFCGEQGIRHSWTLLETPQQNGVAERRIDLVMDIARTSMIHARAPHFLWPYALRYATHQLNLQPRVSRPEPPPGPALSGVSHATPLPSVARQVASPSLQSSSHSLQQPSALPQHVTVDSVGVEARGAATGGTRSRGASSRGAGAGGTGTGGASSGGAGAGGVGTGGASSGGAGAGGASSGGAGAGGTGTGGASSGGAGAGGTHAGGAGTEETGATGSPITSPTARPHHHDTRFQALCRLEREEQERVE
ncbi:unnamed protein product, partial [Closterium sp. NIES-53]